ncbi:MarR family winged helix-turn-helix transcriptional regulator [Brevundimonas diminuta]|uniref:MarR family winged helix-turn-helix transcriptional regulator n=1 Tax=Brevundimonas diminuta TaxID=293 RepID=UPI00320B86D4
MSHPSTELTQADFESLARFRFTIRRYLAFAEQGAKAAGLTSQQHQALLAIKAQSFTSEMTVGDLANRLLLRPHSTAELVNRLVAADLITRDSAVHDRRKVHVRLTARGEAVLATLSARNLRELQTVTPAFEALLLQLSDLVEDFVGPNDCDTGA